jgi:FtsP/CotA-like multicopper oxidase with cupredoxin domain
MRRNAFVFALVLTAACSSTTNDDATPAVDGPTPGPAPYAMPQVLGVDELEDTNPDPNIVEVAITAKRAKAAFIAGKPTDVYAYNGAMPGGVLKAKVGDTVIVHFKNSLPEDTTVHWHGLRISDAMDGSPRIQSPVKPGGTFTYTFTVPDAGTFWYHPHLDTAVQIENGLYGAIVVFDPNKDPVYDAERYLALRDIRLEDDGSISPQNNMDAMMAGRYGNTLLTNGKPAKDALAAVDQGTVERWRIVNTSNARTMSLGVDGATFRVIATDGGLLPTPYTTKRVTVAVGQRYDLEVTYDRVGRAKLQNYLENDQGGTDTLTSFAVDVAASDKTPRTIEWPEVKLPDRAPTAQATITLDAAKQTMGGMMWSINGMSDPMDPLFTWQQRSAVDVTIVNNVATEHPFHFHGQFFEILDAKQPGLKDVVLVPPNGTVKVRAFVDNPGHWMVHCHILEHEENGMMGEIVVTPTGDPI